MWKFFSFYPFLPSYFFHPQLSFPLARDRLSTLSLSLSLSRSNGTEGEKRRKGGLPIIPRYSRIDETGAKHGFSTAETRSAAP